MSQDPRFLPVPGKDIGRLINYLVKDRGVSEADLQRIVELQRARDFSFSEAAAYLGIASTLSFGLANQSEALNISETQGSVPRELLFFKDPSHRISEQIRTLRAELIRRQPDKLHNCVAVVSGNRSDGRSSMAASLALACAQLDQPTLLVDADLRSPVQHRLFELQRGPGLADTLDVGTAPVVSAVKNSPHLHVLTAGKAVTNPQELLCSRVFTDLLQSWRVNYRHVIVDTSAFEIGADAIAVAAAVGATVPLARIGHSSLPDSADLLKQLRRAMVPMLGSVVLTAAL